MLRGRLGKGEGLGQQFEGPRAAAGEDDGVVLWGRVEQLENSATVKSFKM